ncbi:uncharacterized protein METZ01_LOCUS190090 [marine metagenome]|uniref:Uncharacterized protein n=1 Tax=marine metagenome TaxID=408172 RepID=A0A382DFF4_9ZZZZ
MADKKITALTAVSDSDIGADDLLHIVDSPGGTPVNKKMTIAQLFQNVPNAIAVDDITVVSTSVTNLASSFVTDFNLSAASAAITPTLDNGAYTGQLKVMYCSSVHGSNYAATVAITNAAAAGFDQIQFDAIGETAVLIWNGTKWFILANTGSTIT